MSAYEMRGVVVNGDKRGRSIGFPTANVEVPNAMCLPADGVYAGHFTREDGSVHACAINLGRRPTFFEHARLLERRARSEQARVRREQRTQNARRVQSARP